MTCVYLRVRAKLNPAFTLNLREFLMDKKNKTKKQNNVILLKAFANEIC